LGFTFDEEGCFVCGVKNIDGLKIKFERIPGGRSFAKYAFEAKHQGYDGVVHGGILGAVLDDSMAYAIMALGLMPITTEMKIRYRKPVAVGEEIAFEGQVVQVGRKIILTTAVAKGPKGDVRVEAEGKFFISGIRD